MKKLLIIQTAFIGDVILATALIEKMAVHFPSAKINFLVRKGNEQLLENNPHINEVLIWDKGKSKFKNLRALLKQIKTSKYDAVISAHRFASSGYLTAYSGAKHRIGFKSNPFSFKFTYRPVHDLKNGLHEVDRNQILISQLTDAVSVRPKLYCSESDFANVKNYQSGDYVCMAPSSVWKTKELPKQQWLKLIQGFKSKNLTIYLIGGPIDALQNDYILASAFQDNVVNLAGELSLLESAALMTGAKMNYVNDSGPLHIASAVNAPVTAFFCSTIPSFGFGPLSDNSNIVEVSIKLACRPCGLHGLKSCPKKHFDCGHKIDIDQLVS
ncbi:MAG: glycosyltransferase family 9 protein [Crocinitomicaceae bacterium]